MLDLHQGFSGAELRDAPPTVSSLAFAELEVASALTRGRFREAARHQLVAWRLAARVAAATLKERLSR
jgi:hypothetical protein